MNNEKSISKGSFASRTSIPKAPVRFVSFDGGVTAEGVLTRPDRYRFLTTNACRGPVISRGAGLSYAAASFGGGVVTVAHDSFNRILDFDSEGCVVEVEAGIELSVLHDFLSVRGLYLPIQPGHGRITIGGCIAADVHGKNQARDGTFIEQVLGLTLFHPEQGLIDVLPETEPALFRLTCGGYGLTGQILRARLQASRIPSDTIELRTIPVGDVWSGMVALSQEALEADFAYTWHDFTERSSCFGRGFLFLSRFPQAGAKTDGLSGNAGTPILSAGARGSWSLPLLNRGTTRMLNLAFHCKQKLGNQVRRVSLREALFPVHKSQSYFKLFGTRGFHEYQVLMSPECLSDYLESVRDFLGRYPIAVTLASAKLFQGHPELLRFTGEGLCFGLNFPRTKESTRFLEFLDELVVSLRGIPNIIKDSRLPRTVVDACYPGVQQFRDQLRAFDPNRLFRSELSERLGL